MITPLRLTLVPLVLAAAAGGRDAQTAHPWRADVVTRTATHLFACAVGDLDPEHPGNELVAAGEAGSLFIGRPYGRRWVTENLPPLEADLLACVIGDADPERPGNELIVAGTLGADSGAPARGVVIQVVRGDSGWEARTLLEAGSRIDALRIVASGDGETPAVLLALVHDEQSGAAPRSSVRVLTGGEQPGVMEWSPQRLRPVAGLADGIAAETREGALVHARWAGGAFRGGAWAPGRGWTGEAPPTEAFLWPGADGRLVLVEPRTEGAAADPQVLLRESKPLHGALLADLDPDWPADEAAAVGELGRLTVFYAEDGRWFSETVHTDSGALRCVAAGELDPESPGPELVACGDSGRLILAGVVGP